MSAEQAIKVYEEAIKAALPALIDEVSNKACNQAFGRINLFMEGQLASEMKNMVREEVAKWFARSIQVEVKAAFGATDGDT